MRIELNKADFLVVVGITIFGGPFTVIRHTLQELEPVPFATARQLLGAAALGALFGCGRKGYL